VESFGKWCESEQLGLRIDTLEMRAMPAQLPREMDLPENG